MIDTHFALAAADSHAVPTMAAAPYTPALIIGLCVVAGLMTWLALPGKREAAVRRLGLVGLLAVGLVFAAFLVRWTIDLGGMGVYFWLFSAVALFASVRVITHNKPVYSALYFVLTVFATGGLFVLLWAEFIAAALILIYAGAILITYVFVIMLASEAVTGGVGEAAAKVSDHDAISRDPFWAAMTGFAVTGLLVYLIFDQSAATAVRSKVDYDALLKVYQSPGNGLSWESLRQGAEGNVLYADGHVDWSPSVWRSGSVDNVYSARYAKPTPAATGVAADLGSAQELGQELLENQALNVQLAGIILTVAMVGAITLARRRVIVAHPPGTGHDMLSTPATPIDDNPHSIPVYGTDNPRHKAYPEN